MARSRRRRHFVRSTRPAATPRTDAARCSPTTAQVSRTGVRVRVSTVRVRARARVRVKVRVRVRVRVRLTLTLSLT